MSIQHHEQLRGTQPSIGTWLSIGSPVIAELAAECEFDWLLFDLEHGCGNEAGLLHNLQAVRGAKAAAIVRVGAPHADLIARILDLGAHGIMVPHVDTAETARACVEAMRYPPRGRRGFSRSSRVYGYGVRPPTEDNPAPDPLFIAQIETLAGVRAATHIASVDGVDMVFVGPADLRLDLRANNQSEAADYDTCLRLVADAARQAGKPAGILVRNIEDLPGLHALGYSHFGVDSDLAILRSRYQQTIKDVSLHLKRSAATSSVAQKNSRT